MCLTCVMKGCCIIVYKGYLRMRMIASRLLTPKLCIVRLRGCILNCFEGACYLGLAVGG